MQKFLTINWRNYFRQEVPAFYELTFLFILLGALCFFNLPFNPPFLPLLAFVAISAIWLYWRGAHNAFIAYALLCFTIGIVAASWRMQQLEEPAFISKQDKDYLIGTISEIKHSDGALKVLLADVWIPNVPKNARPHKVRINIWDKQQQLKIGNRIGVYAKLTAPHWAVLPNGFDFAQYSYFQQIGAVGYAVSKAKVFPTDTKKYDINIFLNHLRQKISQRISAVINQPASGMVIAALIGDASLMTKHTYEQMQVAGLLHLLAISGMHMTVVVGILYFSFRYLISRSTTLCLRYDGKKVAAFFALLGSTAYLSITGMPVSAERAYIMSSLVLLGIMWHRLAQPRRAIVLAAIFLLLWMPEAALSPGFQMSFMATLGLIYMFERPFAWVNTLPRWLRYIVHVCMATTMAGLITAPYIVHHFHQFSIYTLLANVVGVPIFDFIVMPLAILTLLLMPLSLDKLPLLLLEYTLNKLLAYVELINSLPHAKLINFAISGSGLLFISVGLILWFFLRTPLRHAFIIFILYGSLQIRQMAIPDVLINEDGKLFAIGHTDGKLYFSDNVAARFVRNAWLQFYGQTERLTINQLGLTECSKEKCFLPAKRFLLTKTPLIACPEDINITRTMDKRW